MWTLQNRAYNSKKTEYRRRNESGGILIREIPYPIREKPLGNQGFVCIFATETRGTK